MGSGEAACSKTAAVNETSIDLSALKNAGWSTYNVGFKAANLVKDASVCTYGAGSKVVTAVKDAGLCTYGLGSKAATTVKDKGTASVQNAFWGTLNLGSKAVGVIKENGPEMVKNYIPGPERIEQISPYVNHPATREFVKCFIPVVSPYISLAGAFMKGTGTAGQAVHDDKKSENERLRAENERLKAENDRLKKLEYISTPTRIFEPKNPDDVISVFIAKGLHINQYMANQVVPTKEKMELDD